MDAWAVFTTREAVGIDGPHMREARFDRGSRHSKGAWVGSFEGMDRGLCGLFAGAWRDACPHRVLDLVWDDRISA